jgi:hypothetical protein
MKMIKAKPPPPAAPMISQGSPALHSPTGTVAAYLMRRRPKSI